MKRLSYLVLCSALGTGLAHAQAARSAPIAAAVDRDFSATVPTEDLRHVLVGRSVFLKTAHRLARVYVTNPAVLYAYLSFAF